MKVQSVSHQSLGIAVMNSVGGFEFTALVVKRNQTFFADLLPESFVSTHRKIPLLFGIIVDRDWGTLFMNETIAHTVHSVITTRQLVML